MDWQDLRPRPEDTLDEPVDQAIRHALRQEMGRAQPPDRVWRRISAQITAGPTRRRRLSAPTSGGLLAPLVQGLAAMVLVLLVGLNMLPYIEVEHPVATEETTPLPMNAPADEQVQLDAADRTPARAPAYDVVENPDTVKANLRQQQRQLEARRRTESGRADPDSEQSSASSQTTVRKNPTAAVQPDEDNYWSPPKPRPPAPSRVLPQVPHL